MDVLIVTYFPDQQSGSFSVIFKACGVSQALRWEEAGGKKKKESQAGSYLYGENSPPSGEENTPSLSQPLDLL